MKFPNVVENTMKNQQIKSIDLWRWLIIVSIGFLLVFSYIGKGLANSKSILANQSSVNNYLAGKKMALIVIERRGRRGGRRYGRRGLGRRGLGRRGYGRRRGRRTTVILTLPVTTTRVRRTRSFANVVKFRKPRFRDGFRLHVCFGKGGCSGWRAAKAWCNVQGYSGVERFSTQTTRSAARRIGNSQITFDGSRVFRWINCYT